MAAQRRRLEDRWSEYDGRVAKGDEAYRLLRDTTLNKLKELGYRVEGEAGRVRPARRGASWQDEPPRNGVRPSASPDTSADYELWCPSKEVEDAAMAVAMQFETNDWVGAHRCVRRAGRFRFRHPLSAT